MPFQSAIPAACHGQGDRIDQVDAKVCAAQDKTLSHAHRQFTQPIGILIGFVLASQRSKTIQAHENMGLSAMVGDQKRMACTDLAPMGKVSDQFRSCDTSIAYVIRHGLTLSQIWVAGKQTLTNGRRLRNIPYVRRTGVALRAMVFRQYQEP
ncbi:hypothetical protein ACFSUK_35185 [Sphingobium scionense]|uniref:Uncharacterized protein n=1 Tax=Sphingobium scionense TaxID=1404341 RepID=A0A7W6LMJ4_9SPHN|nr:hypothetical protein [Sphingobium scionense]MBB4147129.1 hypothetical protein [Sphingobium scionense]